MTLIQYAMARAARQAMTDEEAALALAAAREAEAAEDAARQRARTAAKGKQHDDD